jgi:hypothetical protein
MNCNIHTYWRPLKGEKYHFWPTADYNRYKPWLPQEGKIFHFFKTEYIPGDKTRKNTTLGYMIFYWQSASLDAEEILEILTKNNTEPNVIFYAVPHNPKNPPF